MAQLMRASRRNNLRSEYTMQLQHVTDEPTYLKALKRVEALMNAEHGSANGHELEKLVAEIERYERDHYPLDNTGSRGIPRHRL